MKRISLILSAALVSVMMLTSFKGISQEVTIGKQIWMTKNLSVDKFRNGDSIPHAKTEKEWKNAQKNKQPAWCYYTNEGWKIALKKKEPAWCYYNNNPENEDRCGKLYNWYAVNDPRGLAPEGWRVPTDEDWTSLTDFLGGESVAGNKMKSTEFWVFDSKFGEEGKGTNESGFSAPPAGWRDYYGNFGGYGYATCFWSSTEFNKNYAYGRKIDYLYSNVFHLLGTFGEKCTGYSVRCIKD